MRNNNRAIIAQISERSLRADKKRNFYIIMATALTTLLLSSVFSIGMSFMESQKMEQIRVMGTAAHAAVSRPSPAQIDEMKRLGYVNAVGLGNHVATITDVPRMGNMSLTFYYYDAVQWKEMRIPAYTDVIGAYPERENEIMVPYWVLEKMGFQPEIGMEIPIIYSVASGNDDIEYHETFVLSGWFTSYMHIRSGNMDAMAVSEAFTKRHGKSAENEGSAIILFSDNANIIDSCTLLERDLAITETQEVRPVPMYVKSDEANTTTFIALLLIVAFLVFAGYLLIYNVLYISVARDVRFYGLLKTIGTTPRQIRKIVRDQIVKLCVIGIPIGGALSAMLSLWIVPGIISGISSIPTGTVVSFSPLIYFGSATFALLTALLGASKPAKMAASISPVDAQKYTGTETKRSLYRTSARGKPHKMALRNIFRERKRAVIVLLSLFLGLTTFIAITTLVTSMDTDNYIASYVVNDFKLTNNTTFMIGSDNPPKQKFSDSFLDGLRSIPGFASLQYDTKAVLCLTYTEAFGAHLQEMLRGDTGLSEESIASLKEHFSCVSVGVDGMALAKLKQDFDIEAFERGEYLLFATDDPSLYTEIKAVEVCSWPEEEVIASVPVGGFVPYFFHSNSRSVAPTLIMSNALMEKLLGSTIRSELYIDVEDGSEARYLELLKQITEGDYEISRISKIEAKEELRDTKMMLYILGGGIALVLGLIGVLNFVNVMSVGVIVRKREFATMESIGMTPKQVRRMLLYEGVGYASISLAFVLVIGNLITYGIFKLFQKSATYAVFTYPIIPVLVIAILILGICIATPLMVYRSTTKITIVGRLRES